MMAENIPATITIKKHSTLKKKCMGPKQYKRCEKI